MYKNLKYLSLLVTVLLVSGCANNNFLKKPVGANKSVSIVHINDVYILDRLDKVRALRKRLEEKGDDVLLLHGGDFLYPSLMSRSFDGLQMVDVLSLMDGDVEKFDEKMFAVFGNHEFDKGKTSDLPILERTVGASGFNWLNTNIDFKVSSGPLKSAKVKSHDIVEVNGIKVGIFGLTIDSNVPSYAQIDPRYVEIAKLESHRLRKLGAELVIALTHLTLSQDRRVLELGADGPDIIFGGHEHYQILDQVAGRYIIKADADAESVNVTRIKISESQKIDVETSFIDMDDYGVRDTTVTQRIQSWQEKLNEISCEFVNGVKECLTDELGVLSRELIAEEKKIRRFETNTGNWLSDIALSSYLHDGAQISFLNAGSFRLNSNLPKGTIFTRKHLKELLPFDTNLVLIELTGEELRKVIERSITDWTGNGWWLQISGFSFVHDPDNEKAYSIRLASDGKVIEPNQKIRAVTSMYLISNATGQDGYTFLNESHLVKDAKESIKLSSLVLKSFANGSVNNIPDVENRICNMKYVKSCELRL